MFNSDKFVKLLMEANPTSPSWQFAMCSCVRPVRLMDEDASVASTLSASFKLRGRSIVSDCTARNRVAIAKSPFDFIHVVQHSSEHATQLPTIIFCVWLVAPRMIAIAVKSTLLYLYEFNCS